MRAAAALLAFLALFAGGCASNSVNHDRPYYGGIGWSTQAGIEVRHATCLYEPYRMTASGSLHLNDAESAGGSAISLTLYVPLLTGGSVEKTVVYPSPSSTGEDVPFVMRVETVTRGGACDLEVAWAG